MLNYDLLAALYGPSIFQGGTILLDSSGQSRQEPPNRGGAGGEPLDALGAPPLDIFHPRVPRLLRRAVFATLAGMFYLYFLKYTAGGLASWFSRDDLMNLYFSWSRPWTELLKANVFFFTGQRPLGGIYYAGIHWIWGFNPLPYRVGALILVSINLVLLFLVVRELSRSIEVACISLLLTGLNASFFSLYYDTGMIYDVLAFFCYCGAFCSYLRIRRAGRIPSSGETVLILLVYVASLNAKEIAVSLPFGLLLYEFLWHPPAEFRPPDLKRWLLGPARAALLGGALTLVYVVGVIVGPHNLMAFETYRPAPSVSLYLERNAWYLRELSLGVFRPRPSGMLGILAGTLVIACLLRRKHLIFASLMAMVSVLPLAFIPARNGFAFYVPSLFWSLWAAGTMVAVQGLIVKLLTWLASRLGLRRRGLAGSLLLASQIVLPLALFAYVAPLNAKAFEPVLPIYRAASFSYSRYNQEIHRCLPRIPHGAKVLILNDPWPDLGFEAGFLIDLSYDDPTIFVRTLGVARSVGDDTDPKKWDFLLDFADDHFRLPPGASVHHP
jgi:hypothetical protein